MQGWSFSYFDNTTNYSSNYDRIFYWEPMAGQELRRSYTQVEFALPRERPFNIRAPAAVVFQAQPQAPQNLVRDNSRRRFSAMPTNRVKHATMEIYRPPNVRVEGVTGGASTSPPGGGGGRLNVHAKEFTMANREKESPTSRSSSNLATVMNNNNNGFTVPMVNGKGYFLQHSKSSGNGLHTLQQSKSSGNMLHTIQPQNHVVSPRVHFRLDGSTANQAMLIENTKTGLKRSKSLSATDALRNSPSTNTSTPTASSSSINDLGVFPIEMHELIQRASLDPNELSARTLMQLVKLIVERAADSRRYAEPAAKLCINIIEKEKKETFLESLLNMCQLWYQEREKVLKSKYPPFMGFLNEMYCQLKRSQLQLKTHYDGVPPPLLLLTLLSKCCQDCLKPPAIQSLSETECLFFVLTSIGRDLEQELPKELDQVMASVRDAFLTAVTTSAIRKTLLQLIELHAAKWQLPASAVMYYYPGTSR